MEVPTCPVCRHNPLDELSDRRRGVCFGCAKHFGLWLEPPTLRPTRPCQRCGNTQFVCSQLRERGAQSGHGDAYVAPLGIAMAHTALGYTTTAEAAPWAPMGILIAFACRACGLTELYTLDADKLPIGPEYGTFLVDCAPQDGPLR